MIEYKGFEATVKFSLEDNLFVGTIVGIDDSVSFHAKTEAEILKNFHDCVDEYIEFRKGVGTNG